MRTLFLLALASLIIGTASAQQNGTKTTTTKPTATTKPATGTTTPKTTKTPSVPVVNAKDSMLCKPWKLSGVEEFGVKASPNDQQKNDGATFMLETKTAFVTMGGKQVTGTWEMDKPKTWLTVTEDGTGTKWKFKLVKVAKDELVYEYQNPEDLIRTLYYFEPAQKGKK